MAVSHTKEKADSLYKQSKFTEAINVYNRVIEVKNEAIAVGSREDLHILHSNRCACYLQVGDILKALEDANSCVRLNPSWCKGYNRKGACLLRLSLRDEAILSYEKALELDASNAEAISVLNKLRGSTARSAGSRQFPNSLLNYWNVFTTTATRYSKDGYGYLKSFLDILRKYIRQCYYSVLTWWFSWGYLTMYFICIGMSVYFICQSFDMKDGSNLFGSHHSNSAGHTHISYNRGGYVGNHHKQFLHHHNYPDGSNLHGSHRSNSVGHAHSNNNRRGYEVSFSNGDKNDFSIIIIVIFMFMFGAWKLPPLFPDVLGDYARPFFGIRRQTTNVVLFNMFSALIMFGAWKLPPMFPYVLGDYARPFFGMESWTSYFLLNLPW